MTEPDPAEVAALADAGDEPEIDLELPQDLEGMSDAPWGVLEEPTVPAWRRAGAWAIDAALLAAVAAPPLLFAAGELSAAAPLSQLSTSALAFAALLGFAYFVVGHALMGATLGKWLLGLRVTRPDGAALAISQAAMRAGLAVLGAAVLGFGPLLAFFTPRGRGLHDLLSGTVVVRAA